MMPKYTYPLLLAAALMTPLAMADYYEYDAAGRLVHVAYEAGGGIAYMYDDADNMLASMPLDLPPAPVQVQVTRTSATSAQVSWAATPSATGYVIERQVAGSSVWEQVATVGANANLFIDPTLEAGVDYVYRVSAQSSDGRSHPSAEASFLGLPAPSVSQGGVLNGASFTEGQPIAPGSIISIFGSNLGVRLTENGLEGFTASAEALPLGPVLGEYSVMIGGVEAPLFFVTGQNVAAVGADRAADQALFAGQINAQVPWEVALGQMEMVVSRRDGDDELESDSTTVAVAAVSPAFFTFDFGPGRVAAINVKLDENDDVVNGSIAQPSDSFPGVFSQPAKLGGVVTLFANGLGPVEPVGKTGDNSLDALRSATIPLKVFVGGAEAQVLFAGLTPQFVALYQINILIPQAVVPGDEIPLSIEQGGVTSRSDVTIAVRP